MYIFRETWKEHGKPSNVLFGSAFFFCKTNWVKFFRRRRRAIPPAVQIECPLMSQQNVNEKSPANAAGHGLSSSGTEFEPPTSTLSTAEAQVEFTSHQTAAADITGVFTAAASGTLCTQYLLLLLTV